MFEILIDICIYYGGAIHINELESYLKTSIPACYTEEDPVSSYLVSPFLNETDKTFVFKYDCLVSFIKSRYLISQLNNKTTGGSKVYDLLQTMAFGNGPLLDELSAHKIFDLDTFDTAASLYKSLVKKYEEAHSNKINIEKMISGFFYMCIALSSVLTKKDRSRLFAKICGGSITHFYIYGKFVPLDFSIIKITGGKIYDFTNINNSSFEDGKVAFDSVSISFKKDYSFNIPETVFCDCCFNEIAKQIFIDSNSRQDKKFEDIIIDIKSLFRRLYISGSFKTLSRNRIKISFGQGKSRFSLDQLLDQLDKGGLFVKNKKDFYSINEEFHKDVVKLLVESSVSSKLDKLVRTLSK